MFCKLFYYLPEGIKEEVYNYRALDKHHESIEDKVTERMDICNDPNQDVSALRHDVKFYMVTIKHHTQSTKARVQDIALYSAGGKSEGFPSDISTICSICLSPLQARLSTAYKSKKKLSGNQHQGPGIDGNRVIKSSREKIRQAQKETPLGRYDTASKYKAKLVIDAALNNAPTTEVHRSVVASDRGLLVIACLDIASCASSRRLPAFLKQTFLEVGAEPPSLFLFLIAATTDL